MTTKLFKQHFARIIAYGLQRSSSPGGDNNSGIHEAGHSNGSTKEDLRSPSKESSFSNGFSFRKYCISEQLSIFNRDRSTDDDDGRTTETF